MQQLKLFSDKVGEVTEIIIENIKASFKKIGDCLFEVVLEINSNKFLLQISTTMNKIEEMEIVAVKGFIDVTVNVVKTVKSVVQKLYFEC